MALFSLQENVGPEYQRSYPVAIYQEARHRALGGHAVWESFFLVRTDLKKIFAEVHFRISEHSALARPAAPFGGISFDAGLPLHELRKFIVEVDAALAARSCSSITMVHPPAPYQHHSDLVLALLHDAGHQRITTELCAVITITPAPLRERLHEWETRKLAQAEKTGVTCAILPGSQIADVYRFLMRCRDERGYVLSMTEAQVLQLAQAFPEAIRLYVAIKEGEWCAAVLGLQDHPHVLYTFYYGHTAATAALSPMVMLMDFVYADCRARGLHFINLGTSTLHGVTNLPLLQFKLQLAATPLQKITSTKTM